MMTDPVADMLTRIRNASMVGHADVLVPASKLKVAIAKVLQREGFIRGFEIVRSSPQNQIRIYLAYREDKTPVVSGLRRVSKPGNRTYTKREHLPRVHGGLGIAILSTPGGVMTGQEAKRKGVGGEVLCNVW